MHDPDFLLFEACLPIPVVRWRSYKPGTRLTVHRRTNDENRGERVYPWWRPVGYDLDVLGWQIGMYRLVEVWHHEPGDADSGQVCKRSPGTGLRMRSVRWGWQHRDHCHVHWLTFRRIKRWRQARCAECGNRFKWRRDTPVGRYGGDEVWHMRCYENVELRRQKGLLLDWIEGEKRYDHVVTMLRARHEKPATS